VTPRGAADALTRPTTAALALAATAVLALAGCGSSSSKSTSSESTPAAAPPATQTSTTPAGGGGATTQLSLAANPEGQLKYEQSTLSAKAGKVSIAFTNSSPVEHDVKIESSSGGTVAGLEPFQGGTKTLTASLKPGTYKFFCSVPGHRQAGMEGTLTVK
jgi:uncharacterized cupredoxin-like copper-binding protein